MKFIAGWNGGKTGSTCPAEQPCCGHVFYTPVGLGTETDAIVVSEVSQARADWKADQIALRVNNHKRLVEALREVLEHLPQTDGWTCKDMAIDHARELLAQLEAGKGGE